MMKFCPWPQVGMHTKAWQMLWEDSRGSRISCNAACCWKGRVQDPAHPQAQVQSVCTLDGVLQLATSPIVGIFMIAVADTV